jgi:predicted phage terminase large subunit-like protein
MARRGLIAFTEYTSRSYRTADHHREIAAHLEAVERGEIDRLMIIEPPRHGKSELASRRFPAYYLGRNSERGIVAASYNSDLAMDFGRDVRNIVADPIYSNVFRDVKLSTDSKAADRWHTGQGGGYVSAGVGTAVTGRDAELFLIDDPMKDREDANSQRMRDRLWSWYSSVVQSRLPQAIILIQTRWHEDDLAGRIMAEMESGGERWTILHHPAILDGEALWPERYPIDALERVKRAMSPRDWTALFQGRPAPEEGDFFKAEWFRWYDEPPAHLTKYGASDYAITVRDGDWTVHGVCGVDPNDDLYLLDISRDQSDSLTGVEAAIDMMQTHKPVAWVEEKAQIEKAIGPFIKKRQRERKCYTYRVQLPTTGDKMARAQSFRARAAQGKVYLPKNAPWVQDLLAELLMFPSGAHDDQVDVCGLFGRILDKMSPAVRPPKGKETAGLTLDEAVAADRLERDRFAHTTRHIP